MTVRVRPGTRKRHRCKAMSFFVSSLVRALQQTKSCSLLGYRAFVAHSGKKRLCQISYIFNSFLTTFLLIRLCTKQEAWFMECVSVPMQSYMS